LHKSNCLNYAVTAMHTATVPLHYFWMPWSMDQTKTLSNRRYAT